jgi:hypothetical protein
MFCDDISQVRPSRIQELCPRQRDGYLTKRRGSPKQWFERNVLHSQGNVRPFDNDMRCGQKENHRCCYYLL